MKRREFIAGGSSAVVVWPLTSFGRLVTRNKPKIGRGAVTWRMVRTISIFLFAAQRIQP